MKISDLDENYKFHGSPCKDVCKGHKAGWEWGKKYGKTTTHSTSFNNGNNIAVNEPNAKPKIRDKYGKFRKL